MYELYEFANFSQQKVSMPPTERANLDGAKLALKHLTTLVGQPGVTLVQDQVTKMGVYKPAGIRPGDKIHATPLYSKDINASAEKIYFCVSPRQAAGLGAHPTLALITIGHKAGNTFSEYFGGWNVQNRPAEWQSILAGTWAPTFGNSVDMNSQETLVYAHNEKHFGGQPSQAQYTIGTTATRKRIVAGMEKKAIAYGVDLGGEAFFKFNVVVGNDGSHPTQCIRVDTPGIETQHSHPIPELGEGEVNHDSKVLYAIRFYTQNRQLDMLLRLAKYLRVIGAGRGSFKIPQTQRHFYTALRPPECVYWPW